jgi:hypothetical protein
LTPEPGEQEKKEATNEDGAYQNKLVVIAPRAKAIEIHGSLSIPPKRGNDARLKIGDNRVVECEKEQGRQQGENNEESGESLQLPTRG